MEIVSVENAKLIDRDTIDKIGVPSIVLMENAAQQIFDKIKHNGKRFLIVCGKGNNGGDGLALARKLIEIEKSVVIIIVDNKSKFTTEFGINYKILKNIGANIINISCKEELNDKLIPNIINADIVVDAIFGVGLNREVIELEYDIIDSINKHSKWTISVDISSGIDGNSGEVLGIAIKAKETYTIEIWKKGFINYKAKSYLGDIHVVFIGIPITIKQRYSEEIHMLDEIRYRKMIPKRKLQSHKGDFGKVIILAGSEEFVGAAYLTSEAAVRTGSGLVTLIVNDIIYPYLACRMKETILVKFSEIEKINKLIRDADVIACGPGLGKNDENIKMLEKIIKESKCPIVVDADGINQLARNGELINYLRKRAVLTPHPGEMARLLNKSIGEVEANRINDCKEYAKQNDVVMLLKGYNTLISNGYKVVVNTTGNSKMASGGMGDSLTGIIASLIGQKTDIYTAAILGAYIHGHIADDLGKNRYSVNARDIIEEIPKTIEDILIN